MKPRRPCRGASKTGRSIDFDRFPPSTDHCQSIAAVEGEPAFVEADGLVTRMRTRDCRKFGAGKVQSVAAPNGGRQQRSGLSGGVLRLRHEDRSVLPEGICGVLCPLLRRRQL